MTSKRFVAIIYTVLLWVLPVICFGPSGISIIRNRRPGAQLLVVRDRVPLNKFPTLLLDYEFNRENNFFENQSIHDEFNRGQKKVGGYHRHWYLILNATLLLCIGAVTVGIPSSCLASTTTTTSRLSTISTMTSDLKGSLISILDGLSHLGTAGMVIYAFAFTIWTMTVGVTTPIETAAGMAFPLQLSIPLSAIGKIGGAFVQYALAKYLFSEYARKKLEGNEWINKISSSFQSNPYKVALIWRFSPLPEFVKNIGPALVPTLKTRYQFLAILTHGLPFTVLWSCIGNEAAMVARGGQASSFLKRAVAIISWVGLVLSPSLFGWWIKGLGESSRRCKIDDMPSKLA